MTGRYLLDTNVAIAILNGEIPLEERLGTDREIFLNATVSGELYFGAENSARVEENRSRIRRLARSCPVIVCDQETGRHYAIIRKLLLSKGQPIPENDIWIAASARQHGLTLVSRDQHFDYVDDLAVEFW